MTEIVQPSGEQRIIDPDLARLGASLAAISMGDSVGVVQQHGDVTAPDEPNTSGSNDHRPANAIVEYNFANVLTNVQETPGFRIVEQHTGPRPLRPIEDVLVSDEEAHNIARRYIAAGAIQYTNAPDVGATHLPDIVLSEREIARLLPDTATVHDGFYAFTLGAEEQQRLEEAQGEQLSRIQEEWEVQQIIRQLKDREYTYLPSDCFDVAHVKGISQVFRVNNGEQGFNILNFTGTPLHGATLNKVMNALREMDDVTGGASTEDVSVIAILPETLPRFSKVDDRTKAIGGTSVDAVATGMNAIMINERLLKAPEAETPYGNASCRFSVGSYDIEATLYHELMHVMEAELTKIAGTTMPAERFGWRYERTSYGFLQPGKPAVFEGMEHNPSEYGRTKAAEDVAESGAAMFVGGNWADNLSEGRKKAIKELFATRHTGKHGPSFLTCEEVDLDALGGRKIGSQLASGPLVLSKPSVRFVRAKL